MGIIALLIFDIRNFFLFVYQKYFFPVSCDAVFFWAYPLPVSWNMDCFFCFLFFYVYNLMKFTNLYI